MNTPPAATAVAAPAQGKATASTKGEPAVPAAGIAAAFAVALGEATPGGEALPARPTRTAKEQETTPDGSAGAAALLATLIVPVVSAQAPVPTTVALAPASVVAANAPRSAGRQPAAPLVAEPATPVTVSDAGELTVTAGSTVVPSSDLQRPAATSAATLPITPAPAVAVAPLAPAVTAETATAVEGSPALPATSAPTAAATPPLPCRSGRIAEPQHGPSVAASDRQDAAVSGSRPAAAHPRIAVSGRASDREQGHGRHDQSSPSPLQIAPTPSNETARTEGSSAPIATGGIDRERFDRLVDGLAARLKLSYAGDGARVRMNLEPRELGEIVVRLHIRDGIAQASVITDNGDATRMLQGALADLRSALADRGIQLDHVDVRTSGDPTGDRRQQAGQDAGASRHRPTGEPWRFGRTDAVAAAVDQPAVAGVRHGQPISLLA